MPDISRESESSYILKNESVKDRTCVKWKQRKDRHFWRMRTPPPPLPQQKMILWYSENITKKNIYWHKTAQMLPTDFFTNVSSTPLYFPCCPPLPWGLFSSCYFEIFFYFSPLSLPCSCELIYGDDIVGISRSRRDSPWLRRPSFHSMGICFKAEAFLIFSTIQQQTRLFTRRSLEALLFEIKNIITKLSSLEFLAPSSHVKFMPSLGKPRAVVKLTRTLSVISLLTRC